MFSLSRWFQITPMLISHRHTLSQPHFLVMLMWLLSVGLYSLVKTQENIIFRLTHGRRQNGGFRRAPTCGVSLSLSSTKPEFELYLMYSPSMKCSRWNRGEPGRFLNSSTYIWNMSTYKDTQMKEVIQIPRNTLLETHIISLKESHVTIIQVAVKRPKP